MKLTLKILGIPLLFLGLWFVINMSIQTRGNLFNAHLDLPTMVEIYADEMDNASQTIEDFKNNMESIRKKILDSNNLEGTTVGNLPVLGDIVSTITGFFGGFVNAVLWIIQIFGIAISNVFKFVIPTFNFLFNPIWITY